MDYDRLAAIFKALAHPVRLEIVADLAHSSRPPGVVEMGERLGISRFAASFHLEQLREAGVVKKTRVGTRCEHRLAQEALDVIDDWMLDTHPSATLASLAG